MKNNLFKYLFAKLYGLFHVFIRKIIGHRKYSRSKYYGKKIHDYQSANDIIYDALTSNKPFLAARFGDAELRTLVYTIENKLHIRKGFPDYIVKAMQLNAGFYPSDTNHLLRFGELLWNSSKQVDVYGVWFNLLEDYVIEQTSPNACLVRLEGLEPYRVSRPWSKALKGKKVLVVHPFADSINIQFNKKDKLFENKNILPDFTLITYKAIQTNAGATSAYSTWFDSLDKMYSDISEIDFDIAIIGCGAYGLPLAARIKILGKKVIHLAGATQIMFGIRGARWDARPEMQHLFNEYWTRPSSDERPLNAKSVEGGCYW